MPKYAILSHVWGREEVKFEDIGDLSKAGRMLGYEKILLSCAQARRDGLQYVWVDTCCIDKSSSSELSEAINSMFKWYQNAAVCYAYLDATTTLASSQTGDELEEFENSRWFTRGWTLQELIAPRVVEFYGRSWVHLGSRYILRGKISHRTSIPERVLRNPKTIITYSVATRMSWASARNTTRLEDRAYSLLGLFDVHMPLLYGEGKRAFIRLQEEIIKSSDDETILVWDGDFLRGEERLTMLAPDPASFFNSANVEQLPVRGSSSQYTVTNKGLQMHVPLLKYHRKGEPEEFYGILNCHYRNDFTRYIAISLSSLDVETNGIRHFLKSNITTVLDDMTKHAVPTTIIIRRTEDVEFTTQDTFVHLKLKSHPFKYLDSDMSFKITPLFPDIPDGECNWNPDTNILSIRADNWPPVVCIVGFHLHVKGSVDWGLVVVYTFPWNGTLGMVKAIPTTDSFKVNSESWAALGKRYSSFVIYQDEDELTPTRVSHNHELFTASWDARIMVRRGNMLKQSIRILEVDLSGRE